MVSVVCVGGCVSTRELLNLLRYRHEIFMEARHGRQLGRFWKWLHSDALRQAVGFSASYVLVLRMQFILSYSLYIAVYTNH